MCFSFVQILRPKLVLYEISTMHRKCSWIEIRLRDGNRNFEWKSQDR